jgi:hypothetical protein
MTEEDRVEWIYVAQDRGQWQAPVNMLMDLSYNKIFGITQHNSHL